MMATYTIVGADFREGVPVYDYRATTRSNAEALQIAQHYRGVMTMDGHTDKDRPWQNHDFYVVTFRTSYTPSVEVK
jgi:hypothetical protein